MFPSGIYIICIGYVHTCFICLPSALVWRTISIAIYQSKKKIYCFQKKNLSAMRRYEMLTIYFRNYNF